MAETKVIAAISLLLFLGSCAPAPSGMTWEKFNIDGSRTGVGPLSADNVETALGKITEESYVAPNGKIFPKNSSTYKAALDMIEAQPVMAPLKKVIAQSAREMRRGGPNSPLSLWIVDHIREDVAKLTGKRVDFALINSGGIREDLPKGDVLMEDMLSMLPFNNYLCYVSLKGSDLKALIESMSPKFQVMSNTLVTLDGDEIESILIGGETIDEDKYYGVGTIDFLLDGGDRINVGKNAKELIITDVKVIDSILPYTMSYGERGVPIEYYPQDRVVAKNSEEN